MSDLHSQTVAFARDTMMPSALPPVRERGAVKWLRENLFSGPFNIVLTLLAAWLLWVALRDVLPWALRGIWRADSLSDCRAIRDQLYGPGVPAACWAVITERWQQLLFGFYPPSQLWRPPLALLVFLLAMLPVLFTNMPRRLLWLTAAAPFLIVWLLWGGSIWRPVAVALGLALIVWVARRVAAIRGALVSAMVALVLFCLFFLDPVGWLVGGGQWLASFVPRLEFGEGDLTRRLRGLLPLWEQLPPLLSRGLSLSLAPIDSADIGGFTLSFIIGLSGITLSLPLGVLLALARRSELFIVSKIAVVYIEVIRGVPLIVWLLVAQILLNYFLPPGTDFDILLRVVIMVTLFAAAYLAEVIRGGLAALPRGQVEAASSLGLDYWQSMRLIVLPQALRISIPGIVNSFIGLLKDTTLVSIISMFDPMRLSSTIRATTEWGGVYWELYIFVALVFFIVCFAMSRYSMWLERRLERSHR